MTQFLFKRSGTADKRPDPLQMALGEVDLNYNATTGGLFYKDSVGTLIKVGPAQVSATAPNAIPVGSAGNALGEFWYENVTGTLNIWDGISWEGVVPNATPTVLGTVYGRNDANSNAAYGQNALTGLGTSGGFVAGNVAVGCSAMRCSTTGGQNVAVGFNAMCNTSGALFNVAVGADALALNINGNCNIVLGYSSAANLTGSWCNIAIGSAALFAACAAVFNNVAVGTASLRLSTGCNNVAIGHIAGCTLTTGNSNVIIGNCAQAPVVTGSCQLAIGYSTACNWLTGCSNKSIRPGAGIVDCAASTGLSGQLLSSTGANALAWCTPNYISSTALNASAAGSMVVNGCNFGDNFCFTSVIPGPVVPGQILTYAYDSGNPGTLSAQGYLNWCTPNFVSQSSLSPGALIVGCTPATTGGVGTVGALASCNNPGIAPGNYQGVTVSTCTGSGSNALATVVVIDGGFFPILDNAEITSPGTGYALSDQVGFVICGTTVTTTADVCSLNQTTICKAGYLSVGANGGVLTADSTCALGVKWATAVGEPAATPILQGLLLGCSTSSRTALGCNALLGNTTGTNNTALGCGALQCVTVGSASTAVGQGALTAATGASNTAVGASAGCNITTGIANLALGCGVQVDSPTGNCQLAIGYSATANWLTGKSDRAIRPGAGIMDCGGSCGGAGQFLKSNGANAICWGTVPDATPLSAGILVGCTTSAFTAVGNCALACLTTGTSNTAVGINALRCTTSGCCNAAFGINTLIFNTTGNANVAFGNSALGSNTSGSCNTAVGHNALANGNSSNNSVAVGMFAMCRGTADGTTAIGTCALKNHTSGVCNTAVGFAALAAVTTGERNTAIGYRALTANITGSGNTAIGEGAIANVTGSDNVVIGNNAGQNNLSVSGNTIIGSSAALTNNGSYNTIIGFQALCDLNGTNGANNIVFGCCAATSTGGVSGPLGLASNRIVMGNSAHTCAQIQVAWSVTSDVRDKALDPAGVPYGLLFVEQLEPIAYRFCNRETSEVTDEKLRYGFSAQNVRGLEGDIPVISSDDDLERLNITDSHLLPVLVNAIKELSDKNKLLEERITALENK